MARRATASPPAQSDDSAGVAGKSVVLNGGTTGIGLATATLLATYGARVLLFARDRAEVDQAVEQAQGAGGEVYGAVADVTRQREVIRVFRQADKRLGGVD